MSAKKRIYGAGYSGQGGGPTAEERKQAELDWDDAYDNLVYCSAELFREVGGLEAWDCLFAVLKELPTKYSDPRHFLMTRDSDFVQAILVAATNKNQDPIPT